MRKPNFPAAPRLIIAWFIFCAAISVGFMIGLIYLAIELAQWLSRH